MKLISSIKIIIIIIIIIIIVIIIISTLAVFFVVVYFDPSPNVHYHMSRLMEYCPLILNQNAQLIHITTLSYEVTTDDDGQLNDGHIVSCYIIKIVTSILLHNRLRKQKKEA